MAEKDFLAGLGLCVAPYWRVRRASELDEALAAIGAPTILKTTRMGYDGKGQVRLSAPAGAAEAWAAMSGGCWKASSISPSKYR